MHIKQKEYFSEQEIWRYFIFIHLLHELNVLQILNMIICYLHHVVLSHIPFEFNLLGLRQDVNI